MSVLDSRSARWAGAFYLITIASSIPAVLLLDPVLTNIGYITGSGPEHRVLVGCLLDLVNAAACVGTAVALYPVISPRRASIAVGFLAARIYEAAVIVIGVVSLLAIVTLREDSAATDGAAMVDIGRALVAVRDWTFLLGPGTVPAINALLLGSVLLRERLVPRLIPLAGLVGAPLLLVSALATFLNVNERFLALALLATLPILLWELSLGIWLLGRGLRESRASGT